MGTRSVRLDEESERLLRFIAASRGISVSAALKQGLLALQEQQHEKTGKATTAYEIYSKLDLGPGGYAIGRSDEVRTTVRSVLRKKLKR
jgi:hypothetical protein